MFIVCMCVCFVVGERMDKKKAFLSLLVLFHSKTTSKGSPEALSLQRHPHTTQHANDEDGKARIADNHMQFKSHPCVCVCVCDKKTSDGGELDGEHARFCAL